MARTRQAAVPFILVVLFLDTLGIGVILPVLPKLITGFVGDDLAKGSAWFGWFGAVYAAMQFLWAPLVGALGDRFGRRPVILTSLLGAGLDYLLLAFAPSLGWLFAGRVLAGITGASFAAATAYIVDVTPSSRRAEGLGLAGAAFGVGFIAGPAVGGFVGATNLRAPFLVAAALNLLNLVYGLVVLPESLARENRRPVSLARANPLGALRGLARSPLLLGLTGSLVLALLAQQISINVWALYTQDRFGWGPVGIGASLTSAGIGSAIAQGGLVRVIVPRLGERRTMLCGLALATIGLGAFGIATSGWMFYALIAVLSLGGIAGPATQALLSREVGADAQGELQGSLASLGSITAIAGPILGTSLFARYAPAAASPRVPGAPFFAAAALDVVAFILALRLFSRLPPLPERPAAPEAPR
jgi:DHA1 family tetracycline resistance protein-like MFS transporter